MAKRRKYHDLAYGTYKSKDQDAEMSTMKTILILTGPQGSGNHMWSKIFALHPLVYGWRELLNDYWIGHDREPFSEHWRDPTKLSSFAWDQSDYYTTSMSVPYMDNGHSTLPDIESFQKICNNLGMRAKIAVLGRDKNILAMQQKRLRGDETYHKALLQYQRIMPDIFLSFELLYLYREQYLIQIGKQLEFPIWTGRNEIDTILQEDSNSKYFHPVDISPTDALARKSSAVWR